MVPFHAEALVALGRLDEAAALLDPYESLARANDRAVRLASALRSRALLHAAKRDYPAASAAFDESLAQLDRLDNPFERARTLLAYGSFSLAIRQRTKARKLLADAEAIFERLGCVGWAERVRGESSRLGGRAARTNRLTPTEDRIAALVIRGRSNAAVANELFMSPKTVEWNLSKIYKKLGVSSRTELAAKLAASRDAR
jgi:DNA-binding CsgD family transcriptional regulator